MFDIAFTEMALLAVIIIIVVGPKDLPRVMRSVGGWVRKARSLAREFQGGIEQIARETELDELRKDAKSLTSYNPNEHLKRTIDPTGELDEGLSASPPKGSDAGGTIGALGGAAKPDKEPSGGGSGSGKD